jgi:hypothetical protein
MKSMEAYPDGAWSFDPLAVSATHSKMFKVRDKVNGEGWLA